MVLELARIAVAFIGTGAAAYQDHKTSYIDDKILYAMIAIGVIINLLTFDLSIIAFSLGGALAISLIGYLLYKRGQFGAGDVLLFAGLQLLLPFAPVQTTQSINAVPIVNNELYLTAAQAFPFFVTIFITSSLLALLASSAYYAFQLVKKKAKWKPEKISLLVATIASIAFLYWLNSVVPLSTAQLGVFLAILAASTFTVSMKKQIMSEIIVTQVKQRQIESEDVIATEEMDAGLVEKYGITRVYTPDNAERIAKMMAKKQVTTIPVYKNLPRFAPFVLIALILCLLVVNPIAFILFI